jgi:N-glycosylase/DNA lyase
MEEKQMKLLNALAKKIKSRKRERSVVVVSLQSANILTKKENFTGHLKNLDKVFATAE